MRKTILLSTALFALSGGAVFAQALTTSPPAPNSAARGVQPENSVPGGTATGLENRPGSSVSQTRTGPGAMPHGARGHGVRPMSAGEAPARDRRAPVRQGRAGPRQQDGISPDEMNVPPASAYQGGVGSPMSTAASNTTSANTRSDIAPRLPDPNAASNTPVAFLAAARQALSQNRTGAAQEALERAETRVLTRSIEPADARQPASSDVAQQIAAARQALARRDRAAAMAAIDAAMAAEPGGVQPAGATRPVPRGQAPRYRGSQAPAR